jgi:hypothetical protein
MRDKIEFLIREFRDVVSDAGDIQEDREMEAEFVNRVEKYILSLLEAQKSLCKESLIKNSTVYSPVDISMIRAINEAPYPVESSLVVIDKEKLKELCRYAFTVGQQWVHDIEYNPEKEPESFNQWYKNLTL